ncbi:hypothetical protein ACHAXS_014307 [Conticribra weissflogii]
MIISPHLIVNVHTLKSNIFRRTFEYTCQIDTSFVSFWGPTDLSYEDSILCHCIVKGVDKPASTKTTEQRSHASMMITSNNSFSSGFPSRVFSSPNRSIKYLNASWK